MGEPARAPAKAKPVAGKKPPAAKKKPAARAEAPAKGNRRGQRRPLHKNGEQYARQNVFQTHFFFPLTASIMIFWFASAASLLSWISSVTMKKSFHAAS